MAGSEIHAAHGIQNNGSLEKNVLMLGYVRCCANRAHPELCLRVKSDELGETSPTTPTTDAYCLFHEMPSGTEVCGPR